MCFSYLYEVNFKKSLERSCTMYNVQMYNVQMYNEQCTNEQMYNVQCTMYNGMTSNDVFSIMSIYCPIYVNSYIYVVTYRVSHET